MAQVGEQLWLTCYDHRAGDDFSLHRTKEGAEKAGVLWVLDNARLVEEDKIEIGNLFGARRYEDALRLFCECDTEEYVSVVPLTVEA